MAIRNFKMIVSYDGGRYYGWEHQPNTDMTIQGKLEGVLDRMLFGEDGDAGEAGRVGQKAGRKGDGPHKVGKPPVTVIGAGRTDAGVSARAQTCNVLLDTELGPEEIQKYMNRYLPDDISVNSVTVAADRFHSRFKAVGKTYRYTMWYSEDGSKPVFDRKQVTVLREKPDTSVMREAAQHLVGMHDYKSFCGNSHMKKPTVRVVDTINIEESGHYIRVYYHGNGFLQNMVRIMTGTLLACGYGRLSVSDIDRILEAKDRKKAGPTAPPEGLCLMKVDY